MENRQGFDRERHMHLEWKEVCSSINKVPILKDISCGAKTGEILAILGPSGSGKTTLLNCLAGRLPVTSGEILVNKRPVNKQMRRRMGYLQQTEVFFGTLTLKETLTYTAYLRLPGSWSKQQKRDRVQEIIAQLRLEKCQDTVMGDMFIRGLSDGEKKRAAIACELITNPDALLLDEPTSGLDSNLAYNLVCSLTELAEIHHKTIIVAIHQPSSQIYHQFKKVLLLCKGQVAYYGEGSGVIDYFSSLGLSCEEGYNPADFMLEVLDRREDTTKKILDAYIRPPSNKSCTFESAQSGYENPGYDSTRDRSHVINMTSLAESSKTKGPTEPVRAPTDLSTIKFEERSELPKSKWSKVTDDGHQVKVIAYRPKDPDVANDVSFNRGRVDGLPNDRKWPTGFCSQYAALTLRGLLLAKPEALSKIKFLQTAILTFATGVVWFQIPRTEATISDRLGLLFMFGINWSFISYSTVCTGLFKSRAVVARERAAGCYRLSAVLLSQLTSDALAIIIQPTLYHWVFYWAAGLNGVRAFFFSWLTFLLSIFVTQALGVLWSAIFLDLNAVMASGNIVLLVNIMAGGFYQKNLPYWLDWLKYCTYFYHMYHIQTVLEFETSYPFSCAPPNQSNFPQCSVVTNATIYISGKEILKFNGLDWPVWISVVFLIGSYVSLVLACYIVLRNRRPK